MESNSVTLFCDSFLINIAASLGGFLLPLTYLQNIDFLMPNLAANLACIKHLLSKYSLNVIKNTCKLLLTSNKLTYIMLNIKE